MVSSTGGRSELSVRAGQSHAVAPSSAIHFKLKARRQGEQIRVQLGIGNGQHMGLSIYRAGKRIPLTYTLLDSEGKELTSGPLGYG